MLTYLAAHYTSGVNIAIEQVTINILVMALNFALFRVTVRPLQLVGAALTIVGVALIVTNGDLGHILSLTINFGDGLVLASCVICAVYSLALKYRPQTDWMTSSPPASARPSPRSSTWRPSAAASRSCRASRLGHLAGLCSRLYHRLPASCRSFSMSAAWN